MSPLHIANWTSLYLATFILCTMTMTFSLIVWSHFVVTTAPWRELGSWRGRLLFLPKLWWKWQKLYLTGTPVILAVVAYFAASLDW